MPSNLLAGFAGAAQGFQAASENLLNLSLATYKLKQEKERQDRDFKIKDLQIKNLEEETSPERVALEREMLQLNKQKAKNENEEGLLTIKKTKMGIDDELIKRKTEMGLMLKYAPDILRMQTGEGGVSSAPRGSNRLGAIPEITEGISWESGGAKFGKKEVNTQEQLRIEAKRIKDAGGTLSPQQEKLLYGYQKGISLEDLERGFGIEPKGGAEGGDMRSQAIQALKDEGIMVNEDTIAEAIKQLQAYEGD